jgi:hypothetical protein
MVIVIHVLELAVFSKMVKPLPSAERGGGN